MRAGLLRRLGLILVAIAFLVGGVPRVTLFSAGAAPAAIMAMHGHDMHAAAGGMKMHAGCHGSAMVPAAPAGQAHCLT